MILPKDATLNALPPPSPDALIPRIAAAVKESGRKLFVLDDDPTGTQTVYGIPVLTTWTVEALVAELRDPNPLTYILTNSRSLPREGAYTLNREIAANLRQALAQAPRPVEVISRSDSTLRGHFQTEITALREGLGLEPDGIFVVPCFFEGGRYTIDDVHYVADQDSLTPAAETEYAKDAYFGYRNSNLRDWVAEKTGGAVRAEDVLSIAIADLRERGPEFVAGQLQQVSGSRYIVINAADYRDLEVFVLGLTLAEKSDRRFMARTAASYVRVRAGLPARGLLSHAELLPEDAPTAAQAGLVVAGSYILKSTAQIQAACALPGVSALEVRVDLLLDDARRRDEIARAVEQAGESLAAGDDVVIFTSRKLVTGNTDDESLRIGQAVSSALVEIVKCLPIRPRWLIAKGGITSSDVATKALGIRRALVLGQILPGVPVWQAGAESLWPGLTYVVFPGNVGGDTAIARAMTLLRGHEANMS